MKRFFVLFLTLVIFNICTLSANAETAQSKIETMGQNILTKNQLPKSVTFEVVQSDTVNAYADSNNKIVVYTGLLNLVEKDDELAGIMAHEVGHIMKSHCYKQTFFNLLLSLVSSNITNEYASLGSQYASALASNKVSRVQEYDADYTSADLMYKAGYNPLGLVSALNKISSNYVDFFADHPSGNKRVMALYDYINYNYPDAVKKGFDTNSYKAFLIYAEPTLTERANNSKLNDKYLSTQKKLQQKRAKAAKKMMRSTDPWAEGYSALMLMVGQ